MGVEITAALPATATANGIAAAGNGVATGNASAATRTDPWAATFALGGRRHRYFHHAHNCGFPGRRRTERTVELALADAWLCDTAGLVLEIGAVTPYYWPGRITTVIDPADKHPAVTVHASLFDVDLRGFDVLSISTIEHVGERAYGLAEERTARDAIAKIAAEARSFLLTFAVGWNPGLDDLAIGGAFAALCAVDYLVRNPDETWEPAEPTAARRPYGRDDAPWANAVCILRNRHRSAARSQ